MSTNPEVLSDLLGTELAGSLSNLFSQMDWAEDEVEAAQKLRPKDADALYHSFGLLAPSHPLMSTEFVYRSHVREILRRVGRGEDTQPGTWAEIACAMHDVSLEAPIHGAAFGLYARAWNRAFPTKPFPDQADTIEHTEGLYGSQIDDLEAEARHKLSVSDRTLKNEECSGSHHGEPTTGCRYYHDQKEAALCM